MTGIEKELVKRLLVQAFKEGKVRVKLDLPTSISVTQSAIPPAVTHKSRGCLCHSCSEYESCRLALERSVTRLADIVTLLVAHRPSDGRTADKVTIPMTHQIVIEPDVSVAQSTPSVTWRPKEGVSDAMSTVLEALGRHPEGLTVRQIADASEFSRRHVYRVVQALCEGDLIEKSGSRWVLVKTAQLEPTEGEDPEQN